MFIGQQSQHTEHAQESPHHHPIRTRRRRKISIHRREAPGTLVLAATFALQGSRQHEEQLRLHCGRAWPGQQRTKADVAWMDIVRMHYRRPDVQAEVLLDKPGIGFEGPETSGAHREIASVCVVEVPVVLDFIDGPFRCAALRQERSVQLFAVDWPVLIIIARAFAFGASLLLLPLHKGFLPHCDVDMAFDQLD
jgi:hypothetical protein